MGKNTSILLGDYFENYVNEKVRTGKYASVSEIVRTVLRLLEAEEQKAKTLINELEVGEKSGIRLQLQAGSSLTGGTGSLR